MKAAVHNFRTVHRDFVVLESLVSNDTVTLVTVLTLDRMECLLWILEQWEGRYRTVQFGIASTNATGLSVCIHFSCTSTRFLSFFLSLFLFFFLSFFLSFSLFLSFFLSFSLLSFLFCFIHCSTSLLSLRLSKHPIINTIMCYL